VGCFGFKRGVCSVKNKAFNGVLKMRKAVFGFAVLLVFGFMVLGCDNGTTSDIETTTTKFEGTWTASNVNVSELPEPNYAEVEFTFTADTFIFRMTFSDNSQMLYKGTFTYTDTNIECITTHTSDNGSNWTPVSSPGQNQLPLQTYSFSGNDLILEGITFTKKPYNPDNPDNLFEGTWYSPSVNVSEREPDYVEVEFTFTANTFIFKMFLEEGARFIKGTFTYTDTDIYLTTTHTSTNGSDWTPTSSPGQLPLQTYSFSGNDLILEEYTFTKKP
jgi:hypothetical protein